ncbi:DJ-1/PfpI family protein [Photobacterium kishitanii]|uniref:DJ-1/PfpI family protein n=1 Tax=Photobacterium kishitanii TaxID=318456 RepID=A0A2T3KK55_9GAMM|nr:DJ-1/PfpI family protein [Photobacterium kishitanii]OBU27255.1 dimethyladenosine transferase [Photobacterium kishitanii]PSU90456.1 DJ-1/PfpI family protein [Photobacterium kishitanii]PSU99890.1 DJ-1/PfpI family protein [Photobacterium kishitanii]PSV13265.1 DJ-1/PfpI family protein [Photobacterium kishitanii]PSW67787.1 DJ-1/PfpI family protein [Photobacterium kishitanii]
MAERQTVTVLLFEQFELLDALGPLNMFGLLPEHYQLQIITVDGQHVTSTQGISLQPMLSFNDTISTGILIVPGGVGVRFATHNETILTWLKKVAPQQNIICSTSTGAALLANAGLLNNGKATTMQKYLDWVSQFGRDIQWQTSARWVHSNNIFTASGCSASIDMSLAIIGHQHGDAIARRIAADTEYLWLNDPNDDPFAPLHLIK